MLNVNRITTVLARMPDEDLQKYAEMHKADPYIMALAMSESNRRKEVRSADQGSQEEQPKVVDQMIAGMSPRPAQPMPEDMGIGAIPAPNMTMAANGGIVGYDEGGMIAFADGGDVERYQSGGLLDSARTRAQAAQQKLYTYGLQQRRQDPEGFETAQQEMTAARFDLQNAEKNYAAEMSASGINQAAFGVSKTPFYPESTSVTNQDAPRITPTFSADNLSGMDRRLMSGSQPSIASLKTPLPTKAAPPAATSAAPNLMAAPAKFDSIEDLQKKYFGGLDADKAEVKKRREEVASGLSALAQSNLADEEARIAGDKDLFKNKDARLARQEKELAGLDQRNMGLAIFKMGATMMGTSGGIAAAIGAGAGVGAEAYASGIAKIDLAKEKFAEAQDRLDNLKINRNDMNAKELRAAKRGVKEAELQGFKLFQDGAEKDLGLKRQELGAVFTAAASAVDSDKRIAAQQQIAAMQASTKETEPKTQVFKALLAKHGGDVLKANAELQTMGEETLKSFYKKEQLKELAKLKTSTSAAFTPQVQARITELERDVFGGSSVKTASMADIEASAKARGKTVQETLAAAKAQGFVIQ